MGDPYVYSGTNVLRNLLDERSPVEAAGLELELSSFRATELTVKPIFGDFDFDHLCAIHRHLFQDFYDWAGTLRTVQTSKGMPFCLPANIQEQSRFVHARLARDADLRTANLDVFADRLAFHWGEVNVIHAFREGNTRTQRAFFEQLAASNGWVMNFDALDYQSFKAARHQAFITHAQLAEVLQPILERQEK
ncbi:Fic/DOC family protein [Nocardia asteroides]|uniref:Fic/DOC family protein n=1 Tax=Nocardia asteroides TaxID=1824 RepID=UPI001E36BD23|nr:Fic family protein [Nocardia asteroides]UGT64057.1 Fic family protein [Nocardia asteroides]